MPFGPLLGVNRLSPLAKIPHEFCLHGSGTIAGKCCHSADNIMYAFATKALPFILLIEIHQQLIIHRLSSFYLV